MSHYVQLGRNDEARSILEWGISLPSIYRSDQIYHTEIEKLLQN